MNCSEIACKSGDVNVYMCMFNDVIYLKNLDLINKLCIVKVQLIRSSTSDMTGIL